MNLLTDRMGGFISAKIVPVKDLLQFYTKYNQAEIVFKEGKSADLLQTAKNKIFARVPYEYTKAGIIYSVDIEIHLTELNFEKYPAFNKYLVILTTPHNQQLVFGTPDFPLTLSSSPIFAETPAGRNTSVLYFKGKQPHNFLIM